MIPSQIFLKWTVMESDSAVWQLSILSIIKKHTFLQGSSSSPTIYRHLKDLAATPHQRLRMWCRQDQSVHCTPLANRGWFRDEHMSQSEWIRPLGLLGKCFQTYPGEDLSSGAVTAVTPAAWGSQQQGWGEDQEWWMQRLSCCHDLSMDKAFLGTHWGF